LQARRILIGAAAVSGSISNIDGAEYHCNKTAVRKVISGVVGAASSVTSIQVANLLRLFKIPQVSQLARNLRAKRSSKDPLHSASPSPGLGIKFPPPNRYRCAL